MNNMELELNRGIEIVNEAKELEKNGKYNKAAVKYKESRELFKKIGQMKLSAQCLAAHVVNMVRYYIGTRDIEFSSVNMIDFYIWKLDAIIALELNKIDKYDLLINAYRELERIFENADMVIENKTMRYKRKRLYHKYFWQKAKQKDSKFISRFRDIIASFFYFYFDIFCGHGERPIRIAGWIISTVLSFSIAFKCFDLIEFVEAGKTLCFWQSLYFSVVTFTTLGYGDIVPKGTVGQILISVEVFLGYFMMGMLVAFFSNDLRK